MWERGLRGGAGGGEKGGGGVIKQTLTNVTGKGGGRHKGAIISYKRNCHSKSHTCKPFISSYLSPFLLLIARLLTCPRRQNISLILTFCLCPSLPPSLPPSH